MSLFSFDSISWLNRCTSRQNAVSSPTRGRTCGSPAQRLANLVRVRGAGLLGGLLPQKDARIRRLHDVVDALRLAELLLEAGDEIAVRLRVEALEVAGGRVVVRHRVSGETAQLRLA